MRAVFAVFIFQGTLMETSIDIGWQRNPAAGVIAGR
jgi:hypothetical protein